MRISHKNKFVFLAVPKTASTTIRLALTKYSDKLSEDDADSPYHHHVSAKKLKKHFRYKNWNWNEYFKFAFVRNPWDRVVSIYGYLKSRALENRPKPVFYLNNTKTFKEYIFNGVYYQPQLNHFGNISEFYIGKFENLQQDFDIICDKIGIPKQQLPHKNATKHKHYTEYYDDETRQIVAEKYAKDIEYFGYEFGE